MRDGCNVVMMEVVLRIEATIMSERYVMVIRSIVTVMVMVMVLVLARVIATMYLRCLQRGC